MHSCRDCCVTCDSQLLRSLTWAGTWKLSQPRQTDSYSWVCVSSQSVSGDRCRCLPSDRSLLVQPPAFDLVPVCAACTAPADLLLTGCDGLFPTDSPHTLVYSSEQWMEILDPSVHFRCFVIVEGTIQWIRLSTSNSNIRIHLIKGK